MNSLVFYACGGGIGHFNRAYAIARLFKRKAPDWRVVLLSTSPFVPPVLEDISVMRLLSVNECQRESLSFETQIHQVLHLLQPKALVVDTFSQGIQQELTSWNPSCPRIWVQRDLSPEADAALVLRPYPDQEGWVINRFPHEVLPPLQARQKLGADERPLVLAVHNGSPAETGAFFTLLKQACPENVTLRFASLLPHLGDLSYYPLSELLHGADLVIGGGGYNLVAETQALGVPALYFAFERPVDQQLQRVAAFAPLRPDASPQVVRDRILQALQIPRPKPQAATGAQVMADKIWDFLKP